MKKIAIMLIMGGIFLVLSMDATAGITYPRNQMSIMDTELNEWPWDPHVSVATPTLQLTLAQNTIDPDLVKSSSSFLAMPFFGNYFIIGHMFVKIWNYRSLDDGKTNSNIMLIRR